MKQTGRVNPEIAQKVHIRDTHINLINHEMNEAHILNNKYPNGAVIDADVIRGPGLDIVLDSS